MTLVEGIVFILLGQTTSVWWAAALLVPLGIGVAYSSDVALPTFIQITTPLHLLARISSILALPRAVFEPLSIVLLGLVLQSSVAWDSPPPRYRCSLSASSSLSTGAPEACRRTTPNLRGHPRNG